MRVSEIEANTDIVKVGRVNELHQFLRRGQLVRDILQQNTHSQGLGKGAEVLNRGHRRLEFALVESFIRGPQVLNEKTKWNLFGYLESALDLVHRLDAASPVRGSHIHGGRSGATELVVAIERRVHGVQRNTGRAKPVGEFANVLLAVGVVHVLARGEDFDGLGTA